MAVSPLLFSFPAIKTSAITFPVEHALSYPPNSGRLAHDKLSMTRDKQVSKLVNTGRFVCKICYELKPELKLKKIMFFFSQRVEY